MALLNILVEGKDEETLRKKCRPVDKITPRIIQLLDDMKETMVRAQGVGLAAPQVGVLKRLFIVDTGKDGIKEFINPEIISRKGIQTGAEGCLSVPGKYGKVSRPLVTKIRATDRNGNVFEYEGEELISRALNHENDHLDGILYVDKAEEMYSSD